LRALLKQPFGGLLTPHLFFFPLPARAEMTPERLEFRQQQDRQQHSQARAELTPEQLEDWQQQRRDQHRRTTAAESGDDDDHAVSL
jgi:hypothetical protein